MKDLSDLDRMFVVFRDLNTSRRAPEYVEAQMELISAVLGVPLNGLDTDTIVVIFLALGDHVAQTQE